MKIALIAFDLAEYTVQLANALASHEHVTLLIPKQEVAPHIGRLDLSVDLISFEKPRLRQAGRQVQMLSMLRRQIGQVNPQVVHLQQGHL